MLQHWQITPILEQCSALGWTPIARAPQFELWESPCRTRFIQAGIYAGQGWIVEGLRRLSPMARSRWLQLRLWEVL